jgi:hypothetical protein
MRIDESLPDSMGLATPAPKKVVMSRTAFGIVCMVCGGAGALLIVALFFVHPPSALTTSPPPSGALYSPSMRPGYPGYGGWPRGNLTVGQPAYDFTLTEISDGREVRLSGFRDRKPVVLIFGSFHGGNIRDQARELEELHRGYRDRAEFLFIYIDPRVPFSPSTPGDRRLQARQALASWKLTIPCVLDNRYGDMEKMYVAWPHRLVIVGLDGRIALDAGCGLPDGWDLAAVEAWLKGSEAP